jgi:ClpP class serine protease
LFKDFVHEMRPSLDIETVATGEHWYGVQALEKGLVDAVETSDELLLGLIDNHDVIAFVTSSAKKCSTVLPAAPPKAPTVCCYAGGSAGKAADVISECEQNNARQLPRVGVMPAQ